MSEGDEPVAAATVNAVQHCKLPSFRRSSPELWFIQAEAQFNIHHVRADFTQYYLVLAVLDIDTITDVTDIVRSPPEADKYKNIKQAVLARLTDSSDTQMHKLLTGVELGNKRPSQLLRQMRTLAGARVSDDVLRVKWLDLLPQQTRRMLFLLKNQSLEELAEVADEMHDIAPTVLATSHGRSKLPASAAPPQVMGTFAAQLAALQQSVTHLTCLTRDMLSRHNH